MLKAFKRIFYFILILAVLFSIIFYVRTHGPCTSPIKYKIGTFDSRFGISNKDFLKNVEKSSNLWESALNKNLFEYDPNGSLTINLIYDYRQQAVELRGDIDKKNQIAQSQKEYFDELTKKYESKKDSYENAVSVFNSQVSSMTRGEYNQRKSVLDIQRTDLNNLSDEINAYVKKYNILIKNINSNVAEVNKTAGEIEEGFYTSSTNTIDIYEYENQTKLIRVLAHELGHAIGIDHNNNPESIMYKLNQGNKENLTVEDIASIKEVCSIK